MIYNDWQRSVLYNSFVQAFCVRCVSFVPTYVSVHYLISVYTVIKLISQTGKNNKYCLVCEALLTDRVIIGENFRQYFTHTAHPSRYAPDIVISNI